MHNTIMKRAIYLILILTFSGCMKMENVDLIIYNATVYTVDSNFSKAESFAVKDGKILAIGTTKEILSKYDSKYKFDLKGKFVYPGFIDAHCHFYGYGNYLQRADLEGAKSIKEVINKLEDFYKSHKSDFILGRGWDQNLWADKSFPTNEKLNQLYPNKPVILIRIDGHAALVNEVVLKMAGITTNTKIDGGKIEVKNGKLTGILIDNAVDLTNNIISKPTAKSIETALMSAQKNCFAVGLTTVSDAGLDKNVVLEIDSLQKAGKLKMRIYAMLNPTDENIEYFVKKGIYLTPSLSVRSIKLYADGALGSRGACLLQPYIDADQNGFMVNTDEYFQKYCTLAYQNGYQVCTHAIGDSANRYVLKLYASYLKKPNDLRWRIEHAQVVEKKDVSLFGKYNIIPSVQTTHATSDMYWAEQRLGPIRIKNAYAYKSLMEENGWYPNGSDFPVESINPLYGLYAAVYRKDHKGYPNNGFQTENAVTRIQALKAMTIWAAKSNYQEKNTGSLEKSKFADFVILDKDILECTEQDLLNVRVLFTFINGDKVYEKK
jgi:predicted amidohydrolase YtcJ